MAERTIELVEKNYGRVRDRSRIFKNESLDWIVNHDLMTFYLCLDDALSSARANFSTASSQSSKDKRRYEMREDRYAF